jgi:hypothetical protein
VDIRKGILYPKIQGVTSLESQEGVKCVPEIVRFRTPHLFLRWGSHMLYGHSISHNRGGSFGWSELDKFRGG